MNDFLQFCEANKKYRVVRIMVVSKVVDIEIKSFDRDFLIIHYDGLREFIRNNYYNS